MAHEAMSGLYPKTLRTLMGATPEGLERDSWTVTREFEAPLITNDRRGAVLRAYRNATKAARGDEGVAAPFPKGWRERAGSAFGAAKGAGAFGLSGPELRGRASLDVHVKSDGRANVKADGGDLFQDVKVNRGRSMSPAIDA
jgi:hypothetical protein